MQQSQRVYSLDVLRGIAVVVMVMGHSIDAVFDARARTSDLFLLYDAFRGFTAPLFLFISGWAFTLATVKRWEQYRTPGRILFKRLGRAALLLVIGYILHFPFFSFGKILFNAGESEYVQLFQVDVLQCVAVTLLILQMIVMVSRTPRMFGWIAAGAAAGMAIVSPVIWSMDLRPVLSPVFAPYFNQHQLSPFPLFPYAAYMLAGAAVGRWFVAEREAARESRFRALLAAGGVAAILLGIAGDLFPATFYPPHDFWKAGPEIVLIRTGAVALLSVGLFAIRDIPRTVTGTLVPLGQASLLVYTTHLIVVYGSAFNLGLAQHFGQVLPAHLAVTAGLAVLASMVLFVSVWNYVRNHHTAPFRLAQLGAAGMLLYSFLTRPY
jgi:uncharacterized membrane protein